MLDDFLRYQAQTTTHPLGISVAKAQGSYIYDTDNKAYLDFVAGVSACGLGHCPPTVVSAVKAQLDKYLHVMVYGEFSQAPAVEYTKALAENLPAPLESTYLVNSGTEAIEGAIKLARRVTGRSEIIAAENAYHGNTMGSLSLMSYEARKAPFRPLLPDIRHIRFNDPDDLQQITHKTAAVVLETIQGGAGFILPQPEYLRQVKARCEATGTLLVLDEIQPGFGRTGKLFAFEHYGIVPDILVLGKAMASGLPVGSFTASRTHMATLADHPKLGHITTFGGNPVIASACLATLHTLLEGNLIASTMEKEKFIRNRLVHPLIKEIRGKGLMLALILESEEITNFVILESLKKGVLLFWLLFEPKAVRISPPLTISEAELEEGCSIIMEVLDSYRS